MEARYLNVDLLIQADLDLTELVVFLEGKVLFLWKELTSCSSSIGLETNLYNKSGPEEDILELLNLLETLPSNLQHLWANCKKKVLDIGYECGTMKEPIDYFISLETLIRSSRLGCAINIRLYPPVERPDV
jgi:hypothetical protein